MIILNPNTELELFDSMYPCVAQHVTTTNDQKIIEVSKYASCYGFVISGDATATFANNSKRLLTQGDYFCLSGNGLVFNVGVNSSIAFFTRYGFKGQNQIGGPIEKSGRLVYIDNCSDSLLVYPPRQGDPSMSHLHFPQGISQSFHIHPSIRLGLVVAGGGYSDVNCSGEISEIELKQGMVFCLVEREEHRFRTLGLEMDVIAFHPDGDWGPTDHNHTMLNRTYITK